MKPKTFDQFEDAVLAKGGQMMQNRHAFQPGMEVMVADDTQIGMEFVLDELKAQMAKGGIVGPRPSWLDGGAEAVAMAKEDEASAATEQAAMNYRKVRTISMRPGMNEVTLYCEKGVPGFADPGCEFYICDNHTGAEMERLRAELAESDKCVVQALNERDKARATIEWMSEAYFNVVKNMVEAQALLRDADNWVRVLRTQFGYDQTKDLANRIDAFLSALAQPADNMCNHDNPAARCICREEFGHRVCTQPTEVKS